MTNTNLNSILRELPAVHTMLDSQQGALLIGQYGHDMVAEACQIVLGNWRRKVIRESCRELPDFEHLLDELEEYLASFTSHRLKRVVNATGIILHTNLGRAVLCGKAQEAVKEAALSYTNLEYNLEKGERGSRYEHVEDLLIYLTGAESALVVNNNAAAVLLAMNTLGKGREAIVSRGELVEIGGSFRIPEVLKLGGVTLVEVGTTNRTHLKDYQKALNSNTALLLKVHTSNYKIIGFTKQVAREELVKLAEGARIPLVEDLGSGSFLDLSPYGMADETPVPRVVAQGVDVVTFSGDKLLGGPQAGIIAGKKEYIKAMKENQLTRSLRIDKFTLAALEATLREYLQPEMALKNIPVYRMLTTPANVLKEQAERMIANLESIDDTVQMKVVGTLGQMGGGSMPGQSVRSWGIAVSPVRKPVFELEKELRSLPTPVIGYIEKDKYLLDMRTLLPGDAEIITGSLTKIFAQRRGSD